MARIPDVIHRIELPLDDRPHGIDLTQDVLHAAVRRHGSVDVWFKARGEDLRHMRRSFQVVATGQPLPIHLNQHQATAISPDGQLVWHVLENHCMHQNVINIVWLDSELGYATGLCADCRASLRGDGTDGWIPV